MMICPVCGDERTCEDCIAYFAAPKLFTEEERADLGDLCIKFPGKPAATFQRYEATVRVLADRVEVLETELRRLADRLEHPMADFIRHNNVASIIAILHTGSAREAKELLHLAHKHAAENKEWEEELARREREGGD